jgi:hypothetical protein
MGTSGNRCASPTTTPPFHGSYSEQVALSPSILTTETTSNTSQFPRFDTYVPSSGHWEQKSHLSFGWRFCSRCSHKRIDGPVEGPLRSVHQRWTRISSRQSDGTDRARNAISASRRPLAGARSVFVRGSGEFISGEQPAGFPV